jgi:uncharacterized protein (TIGR00288 family)
MKKKAAVLLDLGFVLHALYKPLGFRHASALEVHSFAKHCLSSDEELFRIYCYHCPPFGITVTHPLSRNQIDFSKEPTYSRMSKLIEELELMDNVAFRHGELSFNGWYVPKKAAEDLAKTGRKLEEKDFKPDIEQKRVDMKIGLDVAWLASKSIVDKLILVTADSDFVPAMKFARREGVQVVAVTLRQRCKKDLRVHADETRVVTFPIPAG